MLTINHLEVTYGNQTALSIKSPITFHKGDRIGVIGSNGAGKSTLVKSIMGIVNYTGSIQTDLEPEQIAVHMQFNNYSNYMNVRHIMEAVLNTSIRKDDKLKELISYFQFDKCLDKKYSSLSGGEKQRMTIILILMQQSELVFFDEVTSGLDFETRQKLMELLVKWYENNPVTVCMVTHYYEELEQIADRLLILEEGNVVDYGSKEELFRKYCGDVILSMKNDEKSQLVTRDLRKLKAPEYELVIACEGKEEEMELVHRLVRENINFKRTTNDLEILYINAKDTYQRNGEAV